MAAAAPTAVPPARIGRARQTRGKAEGERQRRHAQAPHGRERTWPQAHLISQTRGCGFRTLALCISKGLWMKRWIGIVSSPDEG